MKTYVATVQVLVRAESFEGACNDIQETLGDGFLMDWAYLQIGGHWLYPTPTPVPFDPEKYQEGGFIK